MIAYASPLIYLDEDKDDHDYYRNTTNFRPPAGAG